MLAAGCSCDYTEAGPSSDELLERVPETEFTEDSQGCGRKRIGVEFGRETRNGTAFAAAIG